MFNSAHDGVIFILDMNYKERAKCCHLLLFLSTILATVLKRKTNEMVDYYAVFDGHGGAEVLSIHPFR